VFRVDIDDEQVVRSLRRYRRTVTESTGLMRSLSFALRNYVRETMSMGGRKRPYEPLAPLTRFRTGRRKPFSTIIKSVKSRYTSNTVEVYFDSVEAQAENWDLEMHHKGFTIPARKKLMVIRPARGGDPIFFRTARRTRVPAREIIPTQREINSVISKEITTWIERGR